MDYKKLLLNKTIMGHTGSPTKKWKNKVTFSNDVDNVDIPDSNDIDTSNELGKLEIYKSPLSTKYIMKKVNFLSPKK